MGVLGWLASSNIHIHLGAENETLFGTGSLQMLLVRICSGWARLGPESNGMDGFMRRGKIDMETLGGGPAM